MKVKVMRITNTRLIIPEGVRLFCDKCMEQLTWDAVVEFFDEWDYPGTEQHFYCNEHLLELAESNIKNELIEL